jgi:hypothetical protein
LFKTAGVRLDVGEPVAIKDASSLKVFLIVELTLTMNELANHRLANNSVSAASPVKAPLMRLRIVKPQPNPFDMSCRSGGFKFEQASLSIPDFVDIGSTVVINPSA